MTGLLLVIVEALAKAGASALGSEVGHVAGKHLAAWIESLPLADRAEAAASLSRVLADVHAEIPNASGVYGFAKASSSIPPAGVGSCP